MPADIGPDQAVLAVEANGMCRTDYEQYRGGVGVRSRTSPDTRSLAASRRSAMWPPPVGRCPSASRSSRSSRAGRAAAAGTAGRCSAKTALIYGLTPLSHAPGLLGGYAEFLVLQPGTQLYAMPDDLSPEDAVLFNPLGFGFRLGLSPGRHPGRRHCGRDRPGQLGLCCVLAAAEAGAGRIIVAGRGRRPWKLEPPWQARSHRHRDTDALPLAETVREMAAISPTG